MRHRSAAPQPASSDPLTLAAGTWLAAGIVLLGMTPLPLHDANWGWSPAFWLLVAPAMLCGARRIVQATTPLRLASIRRSNSRMMR